MHPVRTRHRGPRLATAVALSATVVLSACSSNPEQPETGSDAPDIRGDGDLEDPYDGPYTPDFHDDVEAYVDQEVTLAAAVDTVVSPVAFTITGPDGADVDPLLVLIEEPVPGLEPGVDVVVAATAQDEFEVSDLEAWADEAVPEEPYEEWEGEPYLAATEVSTGAR